MKEDNLCDRLLRLFSDGRWHPGEELADQISYRFGDTIYKLKKRGYQIEKRRIGGQQHEYRLIL